MPKIVTVASVVLFTVYDCIYVGTSMGNTYVRDEQLWQGRVITKISSVGIKLGILLVVKSNCPYRIYISALEHIINIIARC
jgi:hypothetical protein